MDIWNDAEARTIKSQWRFMRRHNLHNGVHLDDC
jgi:hypothetical protein